MAKMKDKIKYMLDAASSITFRAPGAGAITATTTTPAIALDQLDGYWNTQGELADDVFAIAVNVTGIDLTTGDETYTIELEYGPVGFATSIKTSKLAISKTGQYVILVDTDTLKKMKSDLGALRLVATLGGTTPSLTYNAWIAGSIIDAN